MFGSNSFNGRQHIKLTITSGARFPRGCRRRACSISHPKDTPFSTTAARTLRNGGTTASAKSRTNCKVRAVCHKRHSTSYLRTIVQLIGRQLFHLRQPPHSAQFAANMSALPRKRTCALQEGVLRKGCG